MGEREEDEKEKREFESLFVLRLLPLLLLVFGSPLLHKRAPL